MVKTAMLLLAEIGRLADPKGRVSELPLLDVTNGSIERLKDLLEELEKQGLIQREASDFVQLTARGVAAVEHAP
jgi:predicted transcriptional regulator